MYLLCKRVLLHYTRYLGPGLALLLERVTLFDLGWVALFTLALEERGEVPGADSPTAVGGRVGSVHASPMGVLALSERTQLNPQRQIYGGSTPLLPPSGSHTLRCRRIRGQSHCRMSPIRP